MTIPKLGFTPFILGDVEKTPGTGTVAPVLRPEFVARQLQKLRDGGAENLLGAGVTGARRSALRDVGGAPILDPRVLDDTVMELGGRKIGDLIAKMERMKPLPTKPAPTQTPVPAKATAPAAREPSATRPAPAPARVQAPVARQPQAVTPPPAAHTPGPRFFGFTRVPTSDVQTPPDRGIAPREAVSNVSGTELLGRHVIRTPEGVEVVVNVLGHDPLTRQWFCRICDDQGKILGHMRFEGQCDPRERFLYHAEHAVRQYKEGDRFAFLDKTRRHHVSVVLQKDLATFLKAQDARLEVFAKPGSVFERRGVKFRVVRFDPAYSHGRDEWELDINDGAYTLLRDNMLGGTLVLKRRGEERGSIVRVGSDLRFPSQTPHSSDVYFTAMLDLLPFLSEDNQALFPISEAGKWQDDGYF